MTIRQNLIALTVDEQRFGLPLAAVERVIGAVEVTPLTDGPAVVIGVINMQGQILPVISLRRRFRLAERDVRATDQFIIARSSTRRLGIWADYSELLDAPIDNLVDLDKLVSGVVQVRQILKQKDGLILICDPNALLLAEEEREVEETIGRDVKLGTEFSGLAGLGGDVT